MCHFMSLYVYLQKHASCVVLKCHACYLNIFLLLQHNHGPEVLFFFSLVYISLNSSHINLIPCLMYSVDVDAHHKTDKTIKTSKCCYHKLQQPFKSSNVYTMSIYLLFEVVWNPLWSFDAYPYCTPLPITLS